MQSANACVIVSGRKREYPGVAQIGSALEWGSRGRRFDSCHSDQKIQTVTDGLDFLHLARWEENLRPLGRVSAVQTAAGHAGRLRRHGRRFDSCHSDQKIQTVTDGLDFLHLAQRDWNLHLCVV